MILPAVLTGMRDRMNNYPKDIEDKLGMDRIRELLAEKCLSAPGREKADEMSFMTDPERIRKYTVQTDEFMKLVASGEAFPSNHFHDVRNALKKAAVPGAFLETGQLLEIRQSLETILRMTAFFRGHRQEYPSLADLAAHVQVDASLPEEILRVIDDDGQVRDNASEALQSIRRSLRQQQQQLRKSLDSIFREAVRSGFVPEGASITVRDGRMVIPVLAEFKRRIKGFIHDESATGQTVYLEPAAVLEGNNAIKEFQYAESRELTRILTRLTDRVRGELPSLHAAYAWMSLIDFIRAKALLAHDLDATRPESSEKAEVSLVNARHPLLYLNYRRSERLVVPLSLRLDGEQRIIVISGPNAGGKSVCLKTVGLLQYMWQCGMLVPADEESEMGVFSSVFIDIGDEQSIENDLSTYSSHLTFMKYFLAHASASSLLLIDEFGTGTDPLFGGAIAESILERFVAMKARGVITTHYSNIKKYAEQTSAVTNGAMKYDVRALEPLYILQLGKPGSSFSFEVARKIGLPEHLISHARELLGREQIDVEELIVRLEKREQHIQTLERQMRRNEKEAAALREKYETLYASLESDKKEILKKAKEEASSLLQRTNREIEKTIRHIRENKAEKRETRRVRERLEDLKKEVRVSREEKINTVPEKLAVGDTVRILGQEVTGEVLDVRGKDAEIKIGALKTVIRVSRLEKISRGEKKKREKSGPGRTVSANIDLNTKLANFNATLDIRGQRGEEARHQVEKFLDDALLFGVEEVRILHGKGDGILRKLVREQLRPHPHVSAFADEHVERGGAGITVVQLK